MHANIERNPSTVWLIAQQLHITTPAHTRTTLHTMHAHAHISEQGGEIWLYLENSESDKKTDKRKKKRPTLITDDETNEWQVRYTTYQTSPRTTDTHEHATIPHAEHTCHCHTDHFAPKTLHCPYQVERNLYGVQEGEDESEALEEEVVNNSYVDSDGELNELQDEKRKRKKAKRKDTEEGRVIVKFYSVSANFKFMLL